MINFWRCHAGWFVEERHSFVVRRCERPSGCADVSNRRHGKIPRPGGRNNQADKDSRTERGSQPVASGGWSGVGKNRTAVTQGTCVLRQFSSIVCVCYFNSQTSKKLAIIETWIFLTVFPERNCWTAVQNVRRDEEIWPRSRSFCSDKRQDDRSRVESGMSGRGVEDSTWEGLPCLMLWICRRENIKGIIG